MLTVGLILALLIVQLDWAVAPPAVTFAVYVPAFAELVGLTVTDPTSASPLPEVHPLDFVAVGAVCAVPSYVLLLTVPRVTVCFPTGHVPEPLQVAVILFWDAEYDQEWV